ncbi:hypothetical protein GGI11_005949 [Coemansia sp. RSA 2049]|nr:hypothetical protein GGI11_005949 [Coemansia sp. RSA 2049]
MNVIKTVFQGSRAGQQIAANIYSSSKTTDTVAGRSEGGRKGLTLVLAHANGFHKELWEPTLQRLFGHQERNAGGGGWRIDRAVALDGYNHGDSAVMNRETIGDEESSPWFLNARDIIAVVGQLPPPLGGGSHGVVGVGHSWGASSLLLAEIMAPLTFSALIITDPVLFTEPNGNDKVREMTMRRRSAWPDLDAVIKYFVPHPFFGSWDKRILDLYIKHGLETVAKTITTTTVAADGAAAPSAPGSQRKQLVLKCRPANEGAVYAGSYRASPHAAHNLWRIQCPTAFLTGEESQLAAPSHIRRLIKPMPDVQHVVMNDAGHLLVLENPDQTADHYAAFLDSFVPRLAATNNIGGSSSNSRPSTPAANL